jgi:hypothetical protein
MLGRTRTAVAIGALAVAAIGCARHTLVSLPNAVAPVRGITVNGVGDAKAPPDIARTNVGVEVRSETVEQATSEANQRMAAIVAALGKLGIADKDLRTHSFSISFEQQPVPPPQPLPHDSAAAEPAGRAMRQGAASASTPPQPPAAPVIRGYYRASNMLEVTVRDLDKAGQVLQAATDAGANNVWGISFELEDPQPLLARARIEAVEHAKQNAQELAKLSGVKLGAIISISEGGGSQGPVPPMFRMQAEAAHGGDVPIERGEVTVSQQVQLVYALPE